MIEKILKIISKNRKISTGIFFCISFFISAEYFQGLMIFICFLYFITSYLDIEDLKIMKRNKGIKLIIYMTIAISIHFLLINANFYKFFLLKNLIFAILAMIGFELMIWNESMISNKKGVPVIIFAIGSLTASWCATQIFAKLNNYLSGLGSTIYMRVYKPMDIFEWAHMYKKVAPNNLRISFIFFYVIMSLTVFIMLVLIKRIQQKKLTTHGTAQWADKEEIKKMDIINNNNGIVLGRDKHNRTLIDNGDGNAMVIAPTRTGKGVSIIIPTLLTWQGSCVINDIKGENYEFTSEYRSKILKNKILKFEPTAVEGSCCYNPLNEIRIKTIYEYQDAHAIAEIIMTSSKSEDLDHWHRSGLNFLTGMIIYVLYEEKYNTKDRQANLSDIINEINDGETHDKKFNRIKKKKFPKYENIFNEIYNEPDNKGTNPKIKNMAAEMENKPKEERGSIISTTLTCMNIFSDPVIEKNTSKSDFEIKNLMNDEQPLSLYFIIPPKNLGITGLLLKIMITQIIHGLTEKMQYDSKKKKIETLHKLLLVIDEFPLLGKITILEEAIAYATGYGIRSLLVTQSIKQLNKIYTKDNAIMDNCHANIFFTPNDVETPKIIEQRIGKTTVKQRDKNWKGLSLFNNGTTERETQRSLLTTGEILQLDKNENLIFINGKKPIKGKKIWFNTDKEYLEKIKQAVGGE